MIISVVLCIFFLFLGLINSKHNIFSPSVITGVIWLIILSLFWILKHNLPVFSWQFLGAMSLWVSILCVSSLLIQSFDFKVENHKPSQLIRDVFFIISLLSFPFFLLFIKQSLDAGTSGNWAMDLRLAALGRSDNSKEVYGGWHIIVWQVSYIIELFYFSKKNRYRVLSLALIIVSLGVLTMSKVVCLDIALKTICILFFKKKVSVKHMILALGLIMVFFVSIQTLREKNASKSFDKNDFMVLYTLGHPTAFGTLEPSSSNHFGENVFRIYYAITNKLGLSETKPIDPILPFIHKPIETNTYTGMYPFFKDFGYWGVGIFALVYGLLFGWIFKKAQQGAELFVIIYSMMIFILVMQFIGELMFTNIAGYIKQLFLLILPFVVSKHKLFYIKKAKNE